MTLDSYSLNRTLAFSSIVIALAGVACATSPEDDLVFEEGGGKQDGVTRPFGTFEAVQDRVGGFELLRLGEDRTYDTSRQKVDCDPGECTEARSGTYKFASSNGKPYIVLYEGGDLSESLEYKLDRDALELRSTGTTYWFTMTRAASGLVITETDDGGTFDVTEGEDVIVKLPVETGYDWEVAVTDRAFAYPTSSVTAGTMTLTWKTAPMAFLTKVGTHAVTLAYERPGGAVEQTFEFTVNVLAAP